MAKRRIGFLAQIDRLDKQKNGNKWKYKIKMVERSYFIILQTNLHE